MILPQYSVTSTQLHRILKKRCSHNARLKRFFFGVNSLCPTSSTVFVCLSVYLFYFCTILNLLISGDLFHFQTYIF